MLGRLIDEMPDRVLDRMMRSDRWIAGEYHLAGARCLMGHIGDYAEAESQDDAALHWAYHRWIRMVPKAPGGRPVSRRYSCVEHCFDALCERFGTERVLRAIKKRVARVLKRRHGVVEAGRETVPA